MLWKLLWLVYSENTTMFSLIRKVSMAYLTAVDEPLTYAFVSRPADGLFSTETTQKANYPSVPKGPTSLLSHHKSQRGKISVNSGGNKNRKKDDLKHEVSQQKRT